MALGGNIIRLICIAFLGLMLTLPALVPQAHAAVPHHDGPAQVQADDLEGHGTENPAGGCHAGVICAGAILASQAGTVATTRLSSLTEFVIPLGTVPAATPGLDPPPPRLS